MKFILSLFVSGVFKRVIALRENALDQGSNMDNALTCFSNVMEMLRDDVKNRDQWKLILREGSQAIAYFIIGLSQVEVKDEPGE